jgi:aerobic carbon-monoxide dehydrogenase medium subunit
VKPSQFRYYDPKSLDEALDLLANNDNARPLAGGQSLIPMMNFRLVEPEHLIDLSFIPELATLKIDQKLHIGAMTRQRDLEFNAQIKQSCPIIIEALQQVGHRQTRNRGTIGGSLCHLDPASELPALMMLLDAQLHSRRKNHAPIIRPMARFAEGVFTHAMEPDELLTHIECELWPQHHGYSWLEFARRHGDFAIAGVGVMLTLDAAHTISRCAMIVSGLAATPQRLPKTEHLYLGQKIDANMDEAITAEMGQIEIIDNPAAPAHYRRHVAQSLLKQAVMIAYERASASLHNNKK